MAKITYVPRNTQNQAFRPSFNSRNIVERREISLHTGSLVGVFEVLRGPVIFTGVFAQITEAVSNTACTMTWRCNPTDGQADIDFGAAISIQNKALGTKYWSELDGTAIIEVAAGAEMRNFSAIRDNTAIAHSGRGLFVPECTIDIVMANENPTSGKMEMWIEYEPIMPGNKVVIGYGNVASTSSTTSSTSSTSTTSSTTSSTSSSTSTSTSTTTTAP